MEKQLESLRGWWPNGQLIILTDEAQGRPKRGTGLARMYWTQI